ncbi:ubiquinone biosynthesis accessory factor UbiK [Neptunicella marina]|uniref:Ubiquinone biosynthesis accessory factor UbiK n=1 Tax=Neptunicella marina TaxID=2125989 RepID=A0A8J6IVB6_9ALTE|nr:accessory factor UbiK family protein [Neptunicella marina]MBC3766500.1 accessory factor UbiK family protein [Neptunicella marina]
MINAQKIEDIAKQISEAVPPGLKNMAEGAESKVKQILQSQLSKLDVVSREEFDIQSQILIRTREKLTELEARISELEKQAADK